MEELDEFGIPIKKPTKTNVDEFGIPIKKKESTHSTSNGVKSESETKAGSSVGKGFPKIDTNGLAPNFEEMTPAKFIKTPKSRGFASEVYHKLATGSSELGVKMAATPEFLYDIASIPQNYISDHFDLPNLHTDSEKFKKTIGVRNAVKEVYQNEVSKLREESAKVDEKYKYGVYDSFSTGKYEDGFRQLTNSFAESLPATASIMLGGAFAKAPQLLAASSMVFGAGKNEQLKKDNPEMNTNARVVNALGTGLAEGAFETIGSGSIGAAAKGLVEREGVQKATTLLKDGLANFYKSALKKNPILASMTGEGVEEWATQVTQNSIDVATGVKPQDFNVFDGATDAFIGGAFGGAIFGGGLKGLEQIANHQDKTQVNENTKKIFDLQKALSNPELSETAQAEIHKGVDGLIKKNQQLIQKGVEHVETLHPKVKEKLVESIATIEDSKNKAKEIKLDQNISDSQKQILLDNLKADFKSAIDNKSKILEGNFNTVDALPVKEQDVLKREALKELTSELNPDGSKDITIDNSQIIERANKNYLKKYSDEAKSEKPTTETKQETQPQAEEQKAEQEVLNKLESKFKEYKNNDGENIISITTHNEKENLGEIAIKENNGKFNVIDSVIFDEKNKGKGIGYFMYKSMVEEANKRGIEVFSDEQHVSEEAQKVWEKLVKDGLAEKVGDIQGNPEYSERDSFPQFKTKNINNDELLDSRIISKNVQEQSVPVVKESKLGKPNISKVDDGDLYEFKNENGLVAGVMVSPTEFRIDGISSKETGKGKGTEMFEDLIDYLKNKGVTTITTKSAGEGAVKMHQRAVEKGILTEVSKNGREAVFNINTNETAPKKNTPVNGNVRSESDPVVETGVSERKNIEPENVKSTVDSRENKGDSEVVKNDITQKEKESGASGTGKTGKGVSDTFEGKSGKKSLIKRLIEGGNPSEITKAVKELGEDYDIRNQKEANEEAIAFIDKVGVAAALKAIKDGLIPNSDVRMLIYDEALNRLTIEISDEINKNPQDQEALIAKFQEISDDFDKAIRDAGQGISIMNFIYNKNKTLKYNLKKVISDYKRNSVDGKIPDDVRAKFEALNEKLKEIEKKIKEAEKRAKKAEDALVIKNINEDIARKKQQGSKNKSGLTENEQVRKKELRVKFFGRLNDATSMITMLADPEFREYLGLTFKQAKGDFANFSNEILKELGKGARKHLPDLFREAGGKSDVNLSQLSEITIGEDGKIKIPAQLLRDYVEAGETDIDVIASKIKEDISDEFPDVDERDIRDALTGYGKQINPNLDEITAKVNKLKEYGRLLSAYDDVTNGEMPLKSGIKRDKAEQKSRELRREINRLSKELNLESVDLETQWAAALDKIKSNLKNQIEDLDKQIANGEKRKVERTNTRLDAEAEQLKSERDAKKQILDDLVGKPELTEEQRIKKTEDFLAKSIAKLQEEIEKNDIAFKEKPTAVTSQKIEQLKATKKSLLDVKKELRKESGLLEEQRLKTTKTRIKNQIEDLKSKIQNKDFAKKEIKPILADNELNTLRAEKEAIYEEYEKQKYIQELQNRSFKKKFLDAFLESTALTRAIKASLDLGLIGIQLRGFTYSELWRNPKELGRKFTKLFGAIGSQKKTNEAMALLIGHPLHALAKKLDIGITHPDLRNEVREEMASGSLLTYAWNLPVTAANYFGQKAFTSEKRKSIGDTFIDGAMKQFNKIAKKGDIQLTEKEKFSRGEQWKNVNVFEAVERGLSTYGNQLRFEEFVRGVERLRAEGKDEINHEADYKLLASYIRTFSGRAKPAGFEMNQKALNVFFFSFKNAASVFQQLNPVYYGYLHAASSDAKNGNSFRHGTSVANKMAMATMFKSVASTTATILFIMAAYNALKDDDDDELTLETDPRSSDFGKVKIGDLRYDPWGGYIPLITLYARLMTEEIKASDGEVYKMGEKMYGVKSRGDAAAKFLFNKESPGFQMFHHYMTSKEKLDEETGKMVRVNDYGEKLSEDEAFSAYPIFMGSVKKAIEEDKDGVQSLLTAYSVLGLGNVQKYESKSSSIFEDKFLKDQKKKKELYELPKSEKNKIRMDDKLERKESQVNVMRGLKEAQKRNLPYYVSKDLALTKEQVANMDLTASDENIDRITKIIDEKKKEYGIKDKEDE